MWVTQLQREQKENDLWTVGPSVYVVPKEEKLLVGLVWLVDFLKDAMQIVELTVDIANHCDFSFESYQVWLLPQYRCSAV